MRHRSSAWAWFFGLVVTSVASFGASCSSTQDSSAGGGFPATATTAAQTTTAAAGGAGGAPSTGGSGGGFDLGGAAAVSSSSIGGGCASSKVKGTQRPLDIYVMLDQSGSMADPAGGGVSKWKAVTQAIESFVQQPAAAGIGIGIEYFPVPPGGEQICTPHCMTNADCGGACGHCVKPATGTGTCSGAQSNGTDSCNAADYAKPEVEIGQLPGPNNMQQDAMIASIEAHAPTNGTPTAAALDGALEHATAWALANPSDVVIVLLATDGDPDECSPTNDGPCKINCNAGVGGVTTLASAGYMANPSILTFVIGIGNVGGLDHIAMAGGTGHALLVNTTAMNTSQLFLAAMNQIRSAAIGCNYVLPKSDMGKPLDFTKVNLQYTPGGSMTPEEIPKVDSLAACPATGDAWYYDNNAAPTQAILCPATCTKVTADTAGAEVDILLGCATFVH